jgi:hypothetical protein
MAVKGAAPVDAALMTGRHRTPASLGHAKSVAGDAAPFIDSDQRRFEIALSHLRGLPLTV